MFKKGFSIVLVFVFFQLLGQEKIQDTVEIRMLPRVQKDKILLRWAVNESLTWQKTNKSGFILEKYLLVKEGEKLPQLTKLWEKKVIADPLETWQKIVEQNNYAAIIAQAIYGESFSVGGGEGALAVIANTLREREQRFSFALLAADMNFKAAVKAGWGYIDNEVNPNERYVYKIKVAPSKRNIECKGTAVIVSLKDYEPLPAPIDLQGIFGDKRVMITWEYALFKNIYTSYNLERSEDGKIFKPLNQQPLVNLNDKPQAPSKRMFYADSLASNNKTYYYRVQGISPFGEKGLYSDTISGKGRPILPFTPRIRDFKFTNIPNEVVIYWEFPKEGEAITEKFQLNQAPKDSGPYKTVVDNISPSQRQIKYSNLEASNYFKITAVGKTPGQQKTSFSTLIQPVDSIPPVTPVGLEGNIDSLGVVKLSWKANTEKDLLGYRIFRGFTKNEEPSQITVSPIENNSFIDSVTVKNLNEKVYYQVVAVDIRHNHSEKSDVLALEKPDVIPPTAPVFSSYKVTNEGVLLTWINSSEAEVNHVLSRKDITQGKEWEVIYQTTDSIQQFKDHTTKPNKTYRYRIKAIDNAGLESLPSTPLTVITTDLEARSYIKGLSSIVNREENFIELSWKATNNTIVEYTIYKQVQDKKPSTWRVVPSTITKVVDKDVSPNETYTYHIKAASKQSNYVKVETIEVKY